MSLSLFRKLKLPEVEYDLDDQKTMLIHRQRIQDNFFLKNVYNHFYLELIHGLPTKKPEQQNYNVVELGSGAGFLKEIMPEIISSDLVAGPGIDQVFSALEIPFKSSSVDAFVMINVLHHLHDANLFFREVDRCLKVQGKLILIEPANTAFSRFIYKNFHHEPFDTTAGWSFPQGGRLSQANGALPWIIFQRDRQQFEQRYPNLKIVRINSHTPLLYLLSGGLSYRQIFPNAWYRFFCGVEKLLTPLNRYLGLFMTVELRKTKDP
jgi:SAM-dependent methyltransferase